jgi:hypothetical protein
MDEYNYKMIRKNEISIFVENKPESFAVAEIVNDELSYPILEYNHYSLKGNLTRKKEILLAMANDIEPDRKKLNSLQLKYIDNLFNLFNKFIRHNSKNNQYIENLNNNELEAIYDDIYQMWLLAKLQFDNIPRSKRIKEILLRTNSN